MKQYPPLYDGNNTYPALHVSDHDPLTDYDMWQDSEDWHATMTIQLGELIRDNIIVWGEPTTMWDYFDEEQYWRVSEKLQERYFWREIGIVPPGAWMQQFRSHMNLIMPKYKLIYQAIKDGIDLMTISDKFGKSRTIGSDFPATQLKADTQDYAADAADRQYEDIEHGDFLARVAMLQDYDDVDLQIVKSCDKLFSSILTANMNGGNY